MALLHTTDKQGPILEMGTPRMLEYGPQLIESDLNNPLSLDSNPSQEAWSYNIHIHLLITD